MYNIGICDDEKSTCGEIENIIYDFAKLKNIQINADVWYSGESLCNYLKENNRFDLIFLKIELTEMNGIDVGNYIRNELDDYSTHIVFISSKTNYAPSLFKIHPFDFLIKPIQSNEIDEILDNIVHLLERENLFFEFVNDNTFYRIMYKEIEYFYSNKRKIIIVTLKNNLEFYGKLNILLYDLPQNFVMVHQSYIINQDYVSEYSYELIKMENGDIITVSRANRKIVKEKVMMYRLERKVKHTRV